VESLPAALDRATPDQAKRLVAMLVEEVKTVDRRVASIRLRPEALPFFDAAPRDSEGVLRPRTVPGERWRNRIRWTGTRALRVRPISAGMRSTRLATGRLTGAPRGN